MSRRCERPDCAVVATVGYGFDASQRVAWFIDLASTPSATAGALCRRHAAAMVLPRGWWLDDRRPESASRLFAAADVADDASTQQPASMPAQAGASSARVRRARSTPIEQPVLRLDDVDSTRAQPLAQTLATDPAVVVAEVLAPSPATDGDATADADAATHADVESGLVSDIDAPAAIDEPPTPWVPSFDHADDLDGLLDARSPLLARAFRGRRRPSN